MTTIFVEYETPSGELLERTFSAEFMRWEKCDGMLMICGTDDAQVWATAPMPLVASFPLERVCLVRRTTDE